jgi:3-phenylpropionate/trans-cinnamate dioxygenase ferredoxin reductase component
VQHYKYLIVGSGMTGHAAVQGIRSVDAAGKIGFIGAEPDPPYNRPPLSKALWKGEALDSIWRKRDNQNVTFLPGRTVNTIDEANKQAVDSQGERYSWEKLLLATGGTPRRLPFGGDRIIYYRTLGDYRKLRALSEKGRRFAVIGGGFIGSEIAAALAINQKQVTMIFPGKSIGDRVFPQELSAFVSDFYRDKGVELLAGEKVSGLEVRGDELAVQTSSSREVLVDGVVAGIGIEPNVELARAAKLKVENGIVVDEFLRAGRADIFAAGDVAAFYNPALGERIRVEHEDNANTMGHVAGRNMAGESERYHHLPSFYSDLFELGYEAVGQLDSRLETFADWKQPNKEGVMYYLRDGRVRGVLLWNAWGQVDAARALIAEPGPFSAENLKGRLGAKPEPAHV